jgi:hypothetical protein
MTPSPDATAMIITICGATMTSDQNPGAARQAPCGHRWVVPWLPGRTLHRNTANTAITLAGTAGAANLRLCRSPRPAVEGQAAALDLTGCDAIARASQPLPAAARQPGTPARRQGQEAAD